MNVLKQFESTTSELHRLLEVLAPSSGQERQPAITPEWMQHAQEALGRTSALMTASSFYELKSAPQVHDYRRELLRLREAVENSQQQLASQRSAIQAEQIRLRQVRALAGTLESLQ